MRNPRVMWYSAAMTKKRPRVIRPLFVQMTIEEKEMLKKAKEIKHFINMSEYVRTVMIADAKKTIAS